MDRNIKGFDRVKYLLAVLGALAGGLFIIFGPPDMREEVPYHIELGLGFIAFAVLMFAALFNVRAKALLITLISSFVAAGTILVVIVANDWPLWQRGIFGLLGAGGALFAVFSFISIFTGDDPAR